MCRGMGMEVIGGDRWMAKGVAENLEIAFSVRETHRRLNGNCVCFECDGDLWAHGTWMRSNKLNKLSSFEVQSHTRKVLSIAAECEKCVRRWCICEWKLFERKKTNTKSSGKSIFIWSLLFYLDSSSLRTFFFSSVGCYLRRFIACKSVFPDAVLSFGQWSLVTGHYAIQHTHEDTHINLTHTQHTHRLVFIWIYFCSLLFFSIPIQFSLFSFLCALTYTRVRRTTLSHTHKRPQLLWGLFPLQNVFSQRSADKHQFGELITHIFPTFPYATLPTARMRREDENWCERTFERRLQRQKKRPQTREVIKWLCVYAVYGSLNSRMWKNRSTI